jgi:hypothetical protein
VNRTIFLLAALLLSGPALAQTKAEWKASLYGRSTDDSLSSSRTVGVGVFAYIRHQFTENFEAKVLGGALLETGSSSSLFTDEFEPKSRLFLQEASLRWKPFQPLLLIAGALDQRHHDSPLLIDGGTFPAAMLSLDPNLGSWIAHFDAQAAIPTSRTLSTRATAGKENTPTLFTEKAVAGWNERGGARALLRVSHFQFASLTHGMAQDSRFYGNQIAGIGAASVFVYQYEGFEAGPDFLFPLGGRLFAGLGGSFLNNGKAPSGRNQGLYAYADLAYRGEKFSLRPRFEWYRNEADSAPAFYSSPEFGHNNRRGYGAALRFGMPEAKLEIEMKARRGELLEPQTFQKNQFNYLELTVGIPYADF